MTTSFQWFPLLSTFYYVFLSVLALAVITLAVWKRAPDASWRGAFCLLLIFLLLNPVVMKEERKSLPDKLVIVVDESSSQRIAGRDRVAEQALQRITEEAKKMQGMEPIVLRAAHRDTQGGKGETTELFTQLRENMISIPLSQVAGTVFITDGQVHDVPDTLGPLSRFGPFHVVLTGKKDEFDRKVTIVAAPKYGVLEEEIRMTVRVDEFGRSQREMLPMTVYQDGELVAETSLLADETRDFTFTVKHPGQNIFEFKIPVAEGEMTPHNNTAPVIVNGIRDRLRVLLVSDAPHMGKRAWRNLLKSDPAIDLVHFAILRPPAAIDNTPSHEMSLIAFPVDELFNRRIRDFDLIIFDRYQQFGLLLPHYFQNIADFIRDGGAFLMALGTDNDNMILYRSAMGKVLPARPDNELKATILDDTFTPRLTEDGKTHPITADMKAGDEAGRWGKWFTSAKINKTSGTTLMNGVDDTPLLVVDRVDKGRVAVLGSDNIWLWAKGKKTAGPYTELLRNLAHWLMKEPELEEDYIKAEANGFTIKVSQRDIGDDPKVAEMTTPAGETSTITLDKKEDGWVTSLQQVEQNGIYRFSNGKRQAYVIVGTAMNEEFANVRTTPETLKPVVEATGGGIIWFSQTPDLTLKTIGKGGRNAGGDDWIGVTRNDAYTVESVSSHTLLPNGLFLAILMIGMIGVWWRESGNK